MVWNFMNESSTKKSILIQFIILLLDVSQYLKLISISQLTQNGIICST